MASSIFIGYFGGATIKFDGTSITFVNPLLAPDGSASAPSYSFASDTGLGWYRISSGLIGVTNTGYSPGPQALYSSADYRLGASLVLSWSSTTAASGAADVSLSRGAANRLTLAVGDAFNLAPTAFASLPAGAEGNLACVTDSNTATWGATIAGGGANNVLAFHNGTNWTVAAA